MRDGRNPRPSTGLDRGESPLALRGAAPRQDYNATAGEDKVDTRSRSRSPPKQEKKSPLKLVPTSSFVLPKNASARAEGTRGQSLLIRGKKMKISPAAGEQAYEQILIKKKKDICMCNSLVLLSLLLRLRIKIDIQENLNMLLFSL